MSPRRRQKARQMRQIDESWCSFIAVCHALRHNEGIVTKKMDQTFAEAQWARTKTEPVMAAIPACAKTAVTIICAPGMRLLHEKGNWAATRFRKAIHDE